MNRLSPPATSLKTNLDDEIKGSTEDKKKENCVSYFQRNPVLATTAPAGPVDKTLLVKASAPWKCLVQAQDPVNVHELVWEVYGHPPYEEKSRKITPARERPAASKLYE